jgi:hypothetical protein
MKRHTIRATSGNATPGVADVLLNRELDFASKRTKRMELRGVHSFSLAHVLAERRDKALPDQPSPLTGRVRLRALVRLAQFLVQNRRRLAALRGQNSTPQPSHLTTLGRLEARPSFAVRVACSE